MVAICPPLYFPPLWYTCLLHHVDHFILADTFRYRGQSFQNRSKLRNAQGTHWITIPLFGKPQGAPFREVEIETKGRWREKHWRSFLYDYRTTMYFDFYKETFLPFFEREWETLANCTCRSVALQATLFGIDTALTRASAIDGGPTTISEILGAVQADTLVLPSDTEVSPTFDVEIEPFRYEEPEYRQNFEGFEPGVTGLDLLFNYGREAPRYLTRGRIASESPS